MNLTDWCQKWIPVTTYSSQSPISKTTNEKIKGKNPNTAYADLFDNRRLSNQLHSLIHNGLPPYHTLPFRHNTDMNYCTVVQSNHQHILQDKMCKTKIN